MPRRIHHKNMNNTRQNGTYTLFVYRSGSRYIGVCLELDIVDDGTDRDELTARMKKSMESYVHYVCSNKRFDPSLLNRPAPKKYWQRVSKYLESARIQATPPSSTRRAVRPVLARDFFFSAQQIHGACAA